MPEEITQEELNEILSRLPIEEAFDENAEDPCWSRHKTIKLATELYQWLQPDEWEAFWNREVVKKSVQRMDLAEIRHWIRAWLWKLDNDMSLNIEK